MSSIAGFFQPNTIYSKENEFCIKTIHDMSLSLIHRGPDEQSFFYFPQGAFNQNFLLAGYIPDVFPRKMQPYSCIYKDHPYTILFDGFITNTKDLARDLQLHSFCTDHMSVEELLLFSFFIHGSDFIKNVRGGFALIILDESQKTLYLFRDPLGLRPLFYTQKHRGIVFASEIKSLFKYPGICPTLNREGLLELLALGPARKPGSAIFAGIHEVKPGHFITVGRDFFFEEAYHHFTIKEHTDSYEDTLEHIGELLDASFTSLMPSVMPVASLLSGGLDSSIVTAKLSARSQTPLATYSFEFDNSKQHFKTNQFQPSLDAPFVSEMVAYLGCRHTIYTCNNKQQFQYLKKSVLAHDLPAMADIDSSYLYFCERVGGQHKVIFTGECADELFRGYPWYHNLESLPDTFPWSANAKQRTLLLNDDFISLSEVENYANNTYLDTCKEIGIDGANTPKEFLSYRTFYLTLRYFMQTLVNRSDRAAASQSIDARVPFANQELAEYLFCIPYEMTTRNGERKHLLREYSKSYLPETIRSRKKSPYPKTYDPGYEALVNQELLSALGKTDCPLLLFVDKSKAETFCRQIKDLGQPWYGQLMAGPQLAAYYLQILYWIEEYNIEISV